MQVGVRGDWAAVVGPVRYGAVSSDSLKPILGDQSEQL